MRENDIQRELVVACLSQGGYAFKASTPLLKGVADLYLALEPFLPCWIEVKFERQMPARRNVLIGLTQHQHRFLKNVNKHPMGRGACLIVIAIGGGNYEMKIVPRTQLDDTHVFMSGQLVKERGGKWPIRKIIERVVA